LDSLQQGVAIYSADKRLLYLNRSMAAVTGGTSRIGGVLRELASKHRLYDLAGKEVLPENFPIERAFLGEETHDELYEYVGATGVHRWLSTSCIRIEKEKKELQYILTTISDVTHRKSREDKLRFMVESAKILSLTSDFRERLIEKAKLAVPSLADWCGIDILAGDRSERVAVIHQDPKQVEFIFEFEKRYPPDPAAPNSVYNVIRQQKPIYVPLVTDEMLVAGIKSPQHLEDVRRLQLKSVMVIPISARGRGLGALTLAYAESGRTYSADDFEFFKEYCHHVGVLLDNAQLFEELEGRDKAKDLFLASLSHELRNPLAPIKSSLELLKFKQVPADIREELDTIQHQFDHMAKLLGDLLDVTRFTKAKITIEPRAVELRKLIERALRSTDSLLRTADITLHFTYPSSPLFVSADETRLEQAIVNLMSNAAKFTPAGGSIWVDIEKADDQARITIRDNGAGIAAADLPNIFEMYYQSRRASNTNSGLGIGLLLVKQIVTLHGGTIEAKSEGAGRGSEFAITIPLAQERAPIEETERPRTSIEGKRVLIVDDNAPAADSLARLLSKLGATVQTHYSGEETLANPDIALYDLILIDIGMPRLDGFQLVKALRARGLTNHIVALTGYGMADDKDRSRAAGFTAHLTKPVGMAELKELFDAIF
jgi:signal transduction histidine kinase/CheY-like chemotaxis protein